MPPNLALELSIAVQPLKIYTIRTYALTSIAKLWLGERICQRTEKRIRRPARPPAGRCTLTMYIGLVRSEPNAVNCSQLAEVMGLSHDSVNRFLLRERYAPQDLFNEAMKNLQKVGGTLSVDDTVLDKPYSRHMAFVGHVWSGKHHRVVKC